MPNRKTLFVALTFGCAIAVSFALGYVARRNEWISYSTRDRVRITIARCLAPIESLLIDDNAALPIREYATDDGNWSIVDSGPSSTQQVDEEVVETLNALGYLDAYDRPTSNKSGVVFADTQRCFGGYRLYVSGHKPEARLITVGGSLVHSWSIPYSSAFPQVPVHPTLSGRFRRAYAYPNGELLAIFDLAGLVKLSADSNIVWTHSGGSHHDLEVQPDGSIYVIDCAVQTALGQENALVDYITRLTADGKVLTHVSVVDCFRRSPYAALLTHAPEVPDFLHTNALHILSRDEIAALGAVFSGTSKNSAGTTAIALVSCREIDTVAFLDLDERTVVWALTGMWKGQHEPLITNTGTLLVYDNRSLGKRSRLVEIDPFNQAVVWEYEGSPNAPFKSLVGGSVYRLANGNTFVVESTRGRAFELTPEKQIVWEFLSPHRVQKEEELVAILYDMVPIAAEQLPFVSKPPTS